MKLSYVGYLGLAQFTFTVKAPVGRGCYRVYLRPLIEGVTWMEDQGVYMELATRLYNRTAAVSYIDTWTSNTTAPRNSQFINFDPNDCANLVSQMLYTNGFPVRGSAEFCQASVWWKPYSQFLINHYPQSWTLVECQRAFMSY